MTLEWEEVKNDGIGVGAKPKTYRSKVLGGWLVIIFNSGIGKFSTNDPRGITFVPDPEHQWE